jgi:glucose/mannose transport system permease protein
MGITSIKPMSEIRLGNIFRVSAGGDVRARGPAPGRRPAPGWSGRGISVGFWNSTRILIPSLILSIFLGSLNGYALAYWRVKWAGWFFGILMLGAFIPYPVMLYRLVRMFAAVNLFQSIPTSC